MWENINITHTSMRLPVTTAKTTTNTHVFTPSMAMDVLAYKDRKVSNLLIKNKHLFLIRYDSTVSTSYPV